MRWLMRLQSGSSCMRVSSVALAAAASTIITGCGSLPASRATSATYSHIEHAAIRVSASAPIGYGPITSLIGDPNGASVWFWDSSRTQDTIFRENARGKVAAWPVSSGSSYAPEEARSGFAVSGAGTAWLGINSTLVELDSLTGRVRRWHIPPPRDNPGAERHLPPALEGLHAVQALAVGPTGQVAVAMTNSSSVQEFSPRTDSFAMLPMPTNNDEPLSLAYSPTGILGVGFGDLTTGKAQDALIVRPSGASAVAAGADSWAIVPYGSSQFILGAARPYVIRSDGRSFPLIVPSIPLDQSGNSVPVGILPNGWLAAIGRAGVVEFPKNSTSQASAAAVAITLGLPRVQCEPGIISGPVTNSPAAPRPGRKLCSAPPMEAMATDGAGDIWVVSPDRSETVGLLSISRATG